jgi:DNA repair exonuclease SbcCD nuclease subunit
VRQNGDGGARRELVLVHSSDLHLGAGPHGPELAALPRVLAAARNVGADLLLLAGDIFDHNRVPLRLLDAVARALADAAIPVVILPGNHDCLAPGSVYRRGGLSDPPNVHVFGVTHDEVVVLPELNLEIWGRPHHDYADMSPLAGARPRSRPGWRHVTTAHGHWVSGPHDHHRSWLIHPEELRALDTDYVALGHWERAVRVGDGAVPAYYCGSPELARSVNVVRFTVTGAVVVERHPLAADAG